MKYFNLLILFMITLKCRAAEESATIKYPTVEEYSNTEALRSASTTEGKLVNINISGEQNHSENTPINDSDDDAIDVKEIEDVLPISRRLVQQGTRVVKDIGSFIKGIAQLKETNSKDDEGADDSSQNTGINTTSYSTDDNEEKKEDKEPTTVNCSTDENVTNREVSNASTTEASENAHNESTQLQNINISSEDPVAEYTTNANTVSRLTNEFGELPIPKKPQRRTRKVVNIIGSLMEGLVRLNEPDSKEDEGTDNEVVMDVTNSKVFNAVTTKAPENIVYKWIQLPNINSSSETPVIENTLIKATFFNGVSPIKNKEFGKLPIPKKPRRQKTRTVTSIIGSLMEGLARLNEPVSEEDEGANDKKQATVKNFTVTNVTNSEVFDAITTAPKNIIDKWTHLPNINSKTETPIIENTLIKATFSNGVSPFKNKVFGKLPIPKKPRQRTRNVVKIRGSLMEGLARLNEPDSEEDAIDRLEDDEETTIVNFPSVENITTGEVFKASTIEAPEIFVNEWTKLPNNNGSGEIAGAKNTLIKAAVVNTVSPFKNKEIGKLPIQNKPRQRTQKVAKIIGSLMEELAQLNEPDSDEDAGVDNGDTTTVIGSKVDNVSNSEVYNSSTTEAPAVDTWTLLANTNSSLGDPTVSYEDTIIHATIAKVRNPFKKEIGKLPIPIRLPQKGSQLMGSIRGSFVKGLVQGTDANKD